MVLFLSRGRKDGKMASVVGVGVTDDGLRRLNGGEPIVVRLDELLAANEARVAAGLGGSDEPIITPEEVELLIFYGSDDDAIKRAMREYVGPRTVVSDQRNPS